MKETLQITGYTLLIMLLIIAMVIGVFIFKLLFIIIGVPVIIFALVKVYFELQKIE